MFCPKCGTENSNSGKFCRKCGIDLGNVSDALSGNVQSGDSSKKAKKNKPGWESAIGNLAMGVAFMTVSFILGVSGNGRGWWFWLLIPAFGMIGAGVSKIIAVKQAEKQGFSADLTDDTKQISQHEQNALPPQQTEYVSDIRGSKYETGDLVPPSVVENTTRHLKVNKEGETMTLPKDEVT